MKFATLIALATAIIGASAQCEFTGGNYYCSKTNKVTFQNVGFSGSYKDVTDMDESSGKCSQKEYQFSGNLSPLDEELSFHFRGPLKLKQFGVYYPADSSNSNQKRDEEDCSTTQHVRHKHVKRATAFVTETVKVDQYGNRITTTATSTPSTANVGTDSQPSSAETAPAASSSEAAPSEGAPSSDAAAPSSSQAESSSSGSSSAPSAGSGDWVRTSYYSPGSADNCTFLNYHGGSGSGVWSSSFGNSLSYANKDNSGASSSAVALEDTTIGSNKEFVIMSGLKCGDDSENGSCGYYRKGIPAYHGFDGKNKVFVFEFEMPSDGSSGFNADMPAIWALNAKIPRTLQYGEATCSCWKTGCGELDLFEVLSSGSDKMLAHLHSGQGATGPMGGGGGSQDYFQRPTSGSMKAAVVFTEKEIHVTTVDGDFDKVLSSETVKGWLGNDGSIAKLSN